MRAGEIAYRQSFYSRREDSGAGNSPRKIRLSTHHLASFRILLSRAFDGGGRSSRSFETIEETSGSSPLRRIWSLFRGHFAKVTLSRELSLGLSGVADERFVPAPLEA